MMDKSILSAEQEARIILRENPPTPISIEWQLTNRCNERCIMCDTYLRDKSDEVSTKNIKQVIRDLKMLGCRMISFSGGEPFLRKDLFDIIHYCNKKKVLVSIHTNGTLIDARAATSLSDLKIHAINISLHYPDKRQDQVSQLPGSFDRIVKGISMLNKSLDTETKINLRCVLTKENYKSLNGFLKLYKRIHFHSLKFLFVRQPTHDKKLKICLTKKQIKDSIRRIEKLKSQAKFKVAIPFITDTPFDLAKKTKKPAKCLSSFFRTTITPNGNVIPSCYCENIVLGNVTRESFSEIWFGEEIELIRAKTVPFCVTCEQRYNRELNENYKRFL